MYFWAVAHRVSVSQSTIKGIEATLAESHLKPAESANSEAEAKAAIIIK